MPKRRSQDLTLLSLSNLGCSRYVIRLSAHLPAELKSPKEPGRAGRRLTRSLGLPGIRADVSHLLKRVSQL